MRGGYFVAAGTILFVASIRLFCSGQWPHSMCGHILQSYWPMAIDLHLWWLSIGWLCAANHSILRETPSVADSNLLASAAKQIFLLMWYCIYAYSVMQWLQYPLVSNQYVSFFCYYSQVAINCVKWPPSQYVVSVKCCVSVAVWNIVLQSAETQVVSIVDLFQYFIYCWYSHSLYRVVFIDTLFCRLFTRLPFFITFWKRGLLYCLMTWPMESSGRLEAAWYHFPLYHSFGCCIAVDGSILVHSADSRLMPVHSWHYCTLASVVVGSDAFLRRATWRLCCRGCHVGSGLPHSTAIPCNTTPMVTKSFSSMWLMKCIVCLLIPHTCWESSDLTWPLLAMTLRLSVTWRLCDCGWCEVGVVWLGRGLCRTGSGLYDMFLVPICRPLRRNGVSGLVALRLLYFSSWPISSNITALLGSWALKQCLRNKSSLQTRLAGSQLKLKWLFCINHCGVTISK